MSQAEATPLSASDLGELRHELRTPFNGLIGYTEMLLETAEDEGMESFLPLLQSIHSLARDLLSLVNTALAPGTAVRPADLQALGEQVQGRLEPLTRPIEELIRLVRESGREEMLHDAERIHVAAATLTRVSGERLLANCCLLPASAGPSAAVEETAPGCGAGCGVILVVDDNENNRDLLCRRLEREGYAARAARDGREALTQLAAGGIDLVLLDILMPEVDGYEVLHQVKTTPELRDVPVIMISALDEIDSVVRCIEMGAEDYLPKPFDPVLLRARVGACLEKKRLRDKELEYLRGVHAVQEAASAVEAGTFDPDSLHAVAQRADELGRLARVFQHMASEVQAREQRLRDQLSQLRIEVDEARKSRQVAEITGSEFFESLQQKAHQLRRRLGKGE